jgi:quinoprotein glucose dehydrogenase
MLRVRLASGQASWQARMARRLSPIVFMAASLLGTDFAAGQPADGPIAELRAYGGDAGGSRYSPLTQIHTDNVAALKIAWEFHIGDVADGSDGRSRTAFEATPIVAFGTMYLSTPFNRVIALDPESGEQKWSFDPKIDLRAPFSEGLVNRGVTLWNDPTKTTGEPCRRRIFLATIDARLLALDAATGRPCTDFGADGQIDLARDIANIVRRGEYEETSPPAVIDDSRHRGLVDCRQRSCRQSERRRQSL